MKEKKKKKQTDCVCVRPYLQHLVRTCLNTWWHVTGVKRHLLHLGEIVHRVFIQHKASNWNQGVVLMGPNLRDKKQKEKPFKRAVLLLAITILLLNLLNHLQARINTSTWLLERRLGHLGQIERVPRELLRLLKGHDLDVEGPGGKVAIGDGVVQVTDGIVGIGGGQSVRLRHGQILDALISLTGTESVSYIHIYAHTQTQTRTWKRVNNYKPCSGTCSRQGCLGS